jgi:hypothetical protein
MSVGEHYRMSFAASEPLVLCTPGIKIQYNSKFPDALNYPNYLPGVRNTAPHCHSLMICRGIYELDEQTNCVAT